MPITLMAAPDIEVRIVKIGIDNDDDCNILTQ
jgi:hypothetical protein